MKTVRQWLKTIKDTKVRNLALVNCNAAKGSKVGSLKDAIGCAFIWSHTSEGFFYWSGIHRESKTN